MRQRSMWWGALGFGVGAATMFLFDPTAGKRRRQQVADAAVAATRRGMRTTTGLARSLRNQAQGAAATAWQDVHHSPAVDDTLLAERVRSKLGHLMPHPRTLVVSAQGGLVILEGAISPDEERRIADAVRSVQGVIDVEMRHAPHS